MVTCGKAGGQKGNEEKEQTGNYCKNYYKYKETNLIIKLFMHTIEAVQIKTAQAIQFHLYEKGGHGSFTAPDFTHLSRVMERIWSNAPLQMVPQTGLIGW